MISKITKKEYKSIEEKRRNGFPDPTLIFTLWDGSTYRCHTPGGAGLKEIMNFRKEKKRIEADQLDLLGMPTVIS